MRKLLFRKKFLLLTSAALIAAAVWHVARQAPSDTAQEKTAMGSFIAKACTLKTWDFFGWWSNDTATNDETSQASTNAATKTNNVATDSIEEIKTPPVKSNVQAAPVVTPKATNAAMTVERFPLASTKTTSELPPVLVSRPELLLPKYAKPASPTAILTDNATDKTQAGSPQTSQAPAAPVKQDKSSVPAKTSVPTSVPATAAKPVAKTSTTVPSPANKPASNSAQAAMPASVSKQTTTAQAPKRDRLFTKIVDAYTYAYPLVLMNEIQKEMTDSVFFAPVNQMAYMPVLPSPHLRATECPNVDALTSLAWFDLEKEPQVILLPKAPGHAYILALLDAWTNVIDSFGQAKAESFPIRHINGHDAKCFILCGPNCKLKFPADIPVV
ncbi:MAG: DUF1254 domain-containing protein, partial [Planctomycetia bacterium]|nr:DUF1254 domain-containing protein [Planctomycetia bacterium]